MCKQESLAFTRHFRLWEQVSPPGKSIQSKKDPRAEPWKGLYLEVGYGGPAKIPEGSRVKG